jgi:hypothetical protein
MSPEVWARPDSVSIPPTVDFCRFQQRGERGVIHLLDFISREMRLAMTLTSVRLPNLVGPPCCVANPIARELLHRRRAFGAKIDAPHKVRNDL